MEGFKETTLTSTQPFPVDAFLMRNHAASFAYAAHHHEYIELLYVLEGGISLQTSDTRLHAASGDLVVFRSGTLHAVTGTDGPHSQILVVQFLPDLLSGTSGEDPAQQHLQSFLHPTLTQPVLHRNLLKKRSDWHELVMALYDEFISRRPGYELFVRSGLYRMIVFLLRERLLEDLDAALPTEGLQRLAPLLEWLNAHYTEDIHLETAATFMNFSYSYMSRLFRQMTGRSFRSYVEHVRICEAEKWIRSGRFIITQAALEAGFGSASAFARAYRRARGQAPGSLRRY